MQCRLASAYLDPWLTALDSDGSLFLFGWALHHHRLLGLSWLRTSPVLTLDQVTGRALTASGSRYMLGRRLPSPDGLDNEGRIAWEALVLGQATELERRWLGACKAARWLGLPEPQLDGVDVDNFLGRHGKAYVARRTAISREGGAA